jgi:REP element-mobilizing transposase RayT
MSEKFKGMYRSETFRAQWWDYNSNGAYFITICTQNRVHYFGEIQDGQMILSEIGKLVHQFWMEIPNHFPHIRFGEFVVMPDHMHGILILDRNSRSDVSPKHRDNSPKHPNKSTQYPDTSNDVSFDSSFDIQINHPIEKNQSPYFSSISPKSGSIPVAIRSFKSVVSKHAHKLNKDFQWQKLYHDRIIRDFEEFIRIKYYIQNNPKNWLKKNKSNGS